jgi:hypothetical protein
MSESTSISPGVPPPPPPSQSQEAGPPPPPGPSPGTAPLRRRSDAGRITAIIIGSILVLFSLGLLAGGGLALWADKTQRDAVGFLNASHTYRTPTYALTVEGVDLRMGGAPRWVMPSSVLGTVRIRVTPQRQGESVFVGIARSAGAARYLRGVRRAEIRNFGDTTVARTGGTEAPGTPPRRQHIWAASRTGPGTQTILWRPRSGSWSVVVMNADGSKGVDIVANVGARVPSLIWIAIGLLIAGGLFLLGGVALILFGIRERR